MGKIKTACDFMDENVARFVKSTVWDEYTKAEKELRDCAESYALYAAEVEAEDGYMVDSGTTDALHAWKKSGADTKLRNRKVFEEHRKKRDMYADKYEVAKRRYILASRALSVMPGV